MLRVGLTGDLGSGKSTVARMLTERGAVVFSSDEMGRALMVPGQPVFAEIVELFGPGVVAADGSLDRKKLAALAVVQPNAIAVVESALIFSTKYGPGGLWRERFDCVVLVTAPEEQKVARFVDRIAAGRELAGDERAAIEADARRRLAVQRNDEYAGDCLVLHNDGDIEQLEVQVGVLWRELQGSV